MAGPVATVVIPRKLVGEDKLLIGELIGFSDFSFKVGTSFKCVATSVKILGRPSRQNHLANATAVSGRSRPRHHLLKTANAVQQVSLK